MQLNKAELIMSSKSFNVVFSSRYHVFFVSVAINDLGECPDLKSADALAAKLNSLI